METLNLMVFDIGSHAQMSHFILLKLLGGLLSATFSMDPLQFQDEENSILFQWFKCYR